MPEIFHLKIIWEHTLTEILSYDNKSEVGITIRTWVKHHELEYFSSLLNHTPGKFTPSSSVSYYKDKVDSEVLLEMPTVGDAVSGQTENRNPWGVTEER